MESKFIANQKRKKSESKANQKQIKSEFKEKQKQTKSEIKIYYTHCLSIEAMDNIKRQVLKRFGMSQDMQL